MKLRPCFAAALAASSIASVAVAQTTVNLVSNHDNTLYQNQDFEVSNGAGGVMFSGRPNNGLIYRALFSFDLSSIPAGATITAVSLRLHCSRENDATAQLHTMHRVLASWGEGTSVATIGGGGAGAQATLGDCSWNYRFYDPNIPSNSIPWATPGGDFSPTISSSLSVNNIGNYTFTGAGLITDVQFWLNNPAQNFGWVLRSNEADDNTSRRWDTRENSNASFRPLLTVTYVIPAPGTLALAPLCLLASSRRRR